VSLNLCITSERTRQLGIEGHVCELQLILARFMDEKTNDGHARYVELRNLRCE